MHLLPDGTRSDSISKMMWLFKMEVEFCSLSNETCQLKYTYLNVHLSREIRTSNSTVLGIPKLPHE